MADAPKAKRKPQAARPFYLVYTIVDDVLVRHGYSRKTDEVLAALQANPGAKIEKLEAPSGR